ncbi:Rv2578c family radical SAM protein [Demequina sp. B12]|uniref:Rv2578c family radical SAM protein n=1 Tax=Demequina sp. B12 TaxID=2992757 RepID=UPI00237A9BCF|nr:Rv2578c family radical SAM protein [Demequina sp. B12]MDE0573274.1 Rv2578c family radical SAM protein [Demequina sp. B12]
MRWEKQTLEVAQPNTLPGLARMGNLIRSVRTPEFEGMVFHEVVAKSALNKVGPGSAVPFTWTINPYRGCSHACVYCFARPSHTYLELNSGQDFDSQIIVKTNIADVLRTELARPSWAREHVAFGTNTDPYQRAEGRYQLMPDMIAALAGSGTPFSILTKGSLLRRDLPVLKAAAASVPVDVALSIAIFDDDLQRSIEPGTPTTAARLATVTAAAQAGFNVAVFLMPVMPYLTDSADQLDSALQRVKDAGATSVAYSAMHLRPGVKEWFARWLNTHRPDLTQRYRRLYGDSSYAPKAYRRQLAARIKPLLQAHGLTSTLEDPNTGSMGSTPQASARASARDTNGEWRRVTLAPGHQRNEGTVVVTSQPTLF